jgi:hypothetical protein
MCPSLAPARMHRFHSYSVLKVLTVTGRCPANMNTVAPKTGDFQIGPGNKMGDFLENGSKMLIKLK